MILWGFILLVLIICLIWRVSKTHIPRGHIDPFNKERVALPVTLLDSQAQYDRTELLFNEKTELGGTIDHNAEASTVLLSTSSQSGSLAMRQSKRYFRYYPGKSQMILMSFTPDKPKYNVYQEYGYGDDKDGIFFVVDQETLFMVRRSSSLGTISEERISQTEWNMDTLDGKGTSGITFNPGESQALVIDLNWLGVGLVRIGFNIDGVTHFCHGFRHANRAKSTYMSTANLPVRWKLWNKGPTLSGGKIEAISCSISSEIGASDPSSYPFSISNETFLGITVDEDETPLLAIRPKLLFKGITNRVTIIPTSFESRASPDPMLIRAYYNAEINGGLWESISPESAVESNSVIGSFSGGILVFETFVPGSGSSSQIRPSIGSDQFLSPLALTLDIDGLNPDSLLVTGQTVPGEQTIGWQIISWREQR